MAFVNKKMQFLTLSMLEIYGALNLRFFFALQTIQYITRSKVIETETRELSSISRGKIKFGETDDWKNEKLFVPPLPPTNLRGCHLIRIQYDVFVSITGFLSFFRARAFLTLLFLREKLHRP